MAVRADSGWLTGSNSPTSRAVQLGAPWPAEPAEDGHVLKKSRLGYCSKSSFLLSEEYKTLPVCRGWQVMSVSTAGLLAALLQAGAAGSFLVYHSTKGI